MNYYYKHENENEDNDYIRYKPIKIDYPAFIDSIEYNTHAEHDTNISSSRIGILIYGSLYKYPGILENYIEMEFKRGPELNINISGFNRFNNNLTRVIDYENKDAQLIKTTIRIFKKTIGVEQAKRYIVLREGNINYLVHYGKKNDMMINFPEHLNKYEKEIKSKIREYAIKLNLDYIFFQAYPPQIKNIRLYLKDNQDIIKNTKKYIKKCNQLTLLNIEREILKIKD